MTITPPVRIFDGKLVIRGSSSQQDGFTYTGFNRADANNSNISLNGVAEIEGSGILRLTNETSRLIGRAFYPDKLQFKNATDGAAFSFSTAFAFAILPEYPKLGGHGLAFVIAPSKELPGALPSQYLGLLNASDVSNFSNHVFAVEFDTVQDFEFGDINDNHVGIDIDNLASNASAPIAYYGDDGKKNDLNLKGGHTIQAWVDYDGVGKVLKILEMDRVDGNHRGMIKSTSARGVAIEDVKFGADVGNNNRRALRDIRNIVGAPPGAVSKTGLQDRSAVDDKNSRSFVGRRPMTRRFAASLANQLQPCHQVSSARLQPIGSERPEKPLPSAPSSSASDDSNATDVEDFKSATKLLSPMVEEMEELDDYELKEIKMEDLEEEPVPDIDSCDSKNPLAVVEYVEDIYNFYRQIEDLASVSPFYMSNQFDINEKISKASFGGSRESECAIECDNHDPATSDLSNAQEPPELHKPQHDEVALSPNSREIETRKSSSIARSDTCKGNNIPSIDWHGSALGPSQPSCRPWERGDLLQRLATFKPSNWFAKPKAASSLACARRGWINIEMDRIECKSCGVQLTFTALASWTPSEVDRAGEAFAEQLDAAHEATCPWRGNCCADSLVQFPPTSPSALIGGYKDRSDGLLQFHSLPVIASSTIETMRLARSNQIDHLLSQSHSFLSGELGCKADSTPGLRDDVFCSHSHAQKLISLCGWEPRWLPNVQDCEENSAQSAKNACSVGATEDRFQHTHLPRLSKNALSVSVKKDAGKKLKSAQESRCNMRSPLLDCSLCGATVRIWDFHTVLRPSRFGPNTDTPDTGKKLTSTRGVSAASAINGWVAAEEMEKEQIEGRDEAATTDEVKSPSNASIDLNLVMTRGLPSIHSDMPATSAHFDDGGMGRDLMIGQPTASEVGDRAASYESWGPSTRKRCLEEGGSTVDRPQDRIQHADSIEGTVIDWNGDFIVYRHRDGQLVVLPHNAAMPVSLKVLEYDVFISDVFNIRHLTPYAGENSSLRSSFSEEGESDEDIKSDQSLGQSNQALNVPVPATQSQQATSGKPTPGSPRRSKRLQNKRA